MNRDLSRSISKRLSFCGLVVVAFGVVGCQSQGNHEQWVEEADGRWHETRSALMLDMAREQFEAGDLEQASQSVKEGLQVDTQNPRLQVLGGRIALERDKLERAYHLFEGAIEDSEELADAHYYQGVVLQRWQRYEQALKAYERAYDIEPDEVGHLLAVSEMLVQLDRVDDAVERLENKRDYFDEDASLRVALGHLYNIKQDYAQATALFKEASVLDPDRVPARAELGLAQVAAEQYEKAVRTLKNLLAEHPHEKRGDLRRALAEAQVQTRRMEAAQQTYLDLARSDAGEPGDWVRLGELTWQAGDVSGTLHAANRAMDQAPQNHRGYMLSGMALKEREKYEKALRMFEEAAGLAPERANPLLLRGMTLQQQGRRKEARSAYEAALERAPDDERAQKLLNTLARP